VYIQAIINAENEVDAVKDAVTGYAIIGVSSCDRQTAEPLWWSPLILAAIGFVSFVIMLQLLRLFAAIKIAFDPEVTIAAVETYNEQTSLAAAAERRTKEQSDGKVEDEEGSTTRSAELANVYTMREAIDCVVAEANAAYTAGVAAEKAMEAVEAAVSHLECRHKRAPTEVVDASMQIIDGEDSG
jgi:hypothetical protein